MIKYEYDVVTADSNGAMEWWLNAKASLGYVLDNVTTIDGPFGGTRFVITFKKEKR
jgi:hypothetical protein